MTTALSIEALGLTKDEIVDRLIERLAETLLNSYTTDDDGDSVHTGPSRFAEALEQKVMERVNVAIEEIAGKHVLPNVGAYIEGLVLQETNRWGEKTGKPVTFIEYLVQRAEAYLTEQVDYNGKAKRESDSYSWRGTQTRISAMIHEHLHFHIERAMKEALANANSAIVKGLNETVQMKLGEIAAALKVKVETR